MFKKHKKIDISSDIYQKNHPFEDEYDLKERSVAWGLWWVVAIPWGIWSVAEMTLDKVLKPPFNFVGRLVDPRLTWYQRLPDFLRKD